jgi:uncharacterized RDD family membrane protein YckC
MQQPSGFDARHAAAGPAPGVEFGTPSGRLIAWILDGLVLAPLVGVFFGIAGVILAGAASRAGSASGEAEPLAMLGAAMALAGVAVGIAWKPWWWTHGGQTPGYALVGLRVVRESGGGPIGVGQAIGRVLAYVASAFFCLGFVRILFDPRRQGWHDRMAGTVVIAV